ncbi:hypothetical protein K1719_001096 [Acacia pycnantha]|nr:hypothetical protein K1719_001096 [Acacia pycnantha]
MFQAENKLSFLCHLLILTTGQQEQQHRDTVQPKCFNDRGTYTNTSAYHNNLKTLLSNFNSNTKDDYGFYNYSYGQNPDTVYASGLCRGDVTPDVCRSCLKNAAWLLPQNCSNQKEAFLYNDLCILQYSSSSMFGIYVRPEFSLKFNNSEEAADADEYTDALDRLMQALKTNAADGGSDRKVAAGNSLNLSSGQTVHGMAQCTPDLTKQKCDDCLVNAISGIPLCCQNKIGGRIIKQNCNLRFEKVQFYNPTPVRQGMAKLEAREWLKYNRSFENVVDRPTMASVGVMLSSHSVSLPVPSKPPFLMNNTSSIMKDSSSEATTSSEGRRNYVQASRNEVSITDLSPR